MFTNGTYTFNNGQISFKVVISSTGVLVSLDAPKAMTMADFFNPAYWTRET